MILSAGLPMAPKKNSKIPIDNHIIRYIPPSRLRKDENDKVIGVLGVAFALKPNEKYLSATWLEYFPDKVDAVIAIRNSNLSVKPKSGFAIGKVDSIQSACLYSSATRVFIVYDPTILPKPNLGHVAVKNFPSDDTGLLELLAAEAWADGLILNSDIP